MRLFLTVLLVWASEMAWAQPEQYLTSESFVPGLNHKFEYQLADGHFLVDQRPHSEWTLSESGRQWWFSPSQTLFSRVRVVNQTEHSNFVIYAPDNYTMESMSFRVNYGDETQAKTFVTGSMAPFSHRNPQTRYLAAPFELRPGQSAVIEVAQWGTYKYKHNFHIVSERAFDNLNESNERFFGFYFGILAVTVAIFSALYVGLRDRSFIMYVVFCVSFFLNAFSNIGFLGEWPWLALGIPVASFARGFLSIPMFTAILFCQALLETKVHSPRWHKVLNGLVVLNIIYLAVRMMPGHSLVLSLGFTILMLASLVSLTGIGVYRWFQGYRPAILYTIAWISVFCGTVVWLLQSYNLIENSFSTVHAPYISQSIEIMLLAATVVDRYSLLLRDAYKAKALIKEKEHLRDLLRLIAHDLANPLTVMSYAANRMRSDRRWEGADVKSLGAKIERASTAMTNILAGVRNQLALDDGKIKLVTAPVKFADMASELAEIFQNRLQEKSIKLEIHDPENVVFNVARTEFIYQVLCNLMSNALKFSPKGSVIILETKDTGLAREVSVIDFGVGMSKEVMANLFSNYMATTRLGTAGEIGTGFGMPLMKSYVEQMGGKVRVESKEQVPGSDDHGTKFTIIF